MLKNKTLSDIKGIMNSIGCFNKAYSDNMLHESYTNEEIDEENKYVEPKKTSKQGSSDSDNEFTVIEITSDHAILYNATPANLLPSLLQNGPSVEFVGKGAGTYVWGRGVYSNYQMNQPYYRTVDNKSLYGTVLVKYRYNGNLMKECLVAEKGLKRMGKLSQQIQRFSGLEEYLTKRGLNLNRLDSYTDNNDVASTMGLSMIVDACGGYERVADVLLSFGVQGLVFYGRNDKPVAVIYNSDKLEIIGYMDNSKKRGVWTDHENKWETPKDGEGKVKDMNNTNVVLQYFKNFKGDPKLSRAFCGEILLTDKTTEKQTFVDVNKANKIIDNLGHDDPRLFGDFEFETALPFNVYNGKEMAFVQIEKDENTTFYIDKSGNLFKNKNDKHPSSNIKDYYGNPNEPMNNDVDNKFDLDFDNVMSQGKGKQKQDDIDFDKFKDLFGESIIRRITESLQSEDRVETPDGHVEMDNFALAKKLMKFNGNDDVYFIQLVERHKDHPDRHYETNACAYHDWFEITSLEHLNAVEPVIKRMCQKYEWRAMMYINSRPMGDTHEFATEVLKPRFKKYNSSMQGHEVEVAYGQSKDWPNRPLCFVDVDNNDPKVHKQVLDYINKMGLKPLDMYKSTNNGLHIILPDKDEAKKLDFSFLDGGKQMGRWATAGVEIDKSITLYAYVKAKGYGTQQRMQQRLSKR